MTLASRIAVMDRGSVCQIGTPTEVYEFPNSRFVAGFIGSINQFEGSITTVANGHVTVDCPDLDASFEIAHGGKLSPGDKVAVAIRPEKIHITRSEPASSRNRLSGKVLDLGYFGKDSLYRVKLAGGAVIRVNHVNDRRGHESERVADWADDVWLTFAPGSAILLRD